MRDMTFGEWIGETLELERTAFGQDPPNMVGDELADWWTQMGWAAADEIHEMLDEVKYKAWTTDRGTIVDRGRFISEAADALHFVGLLLASVECTGEELTAAYLLKMEINRQRQAQDGGDDEGVRRCPGCKRSLDDAGFVDLHIGGGLQTLCAACRFLLPETNAIYARAVAEIKGMKA